MAKLDYDTLNSTIRYLMFSVFSVRPGALAYEDDARADVAEETAAFLKLQEEKGGSWCAACTTSPGCAPTPTS